jgi:hypothetical protein
MIRILICRIRTTAGAPAKPPFRRTAARKHTSKFTRFSLIDFDPL